MEGVEWREIVKAEDLADQRLLEKEKLLRNEAKLLYKEELERQIKEKTRNKILDESLSLSTNWATESGIQERRELRHQIKERQNNLRKEYEQALSGKEEKLRTEKLLQIKQERETLQRISQEKAEKERQQRIEEEKLQEMQQENYEKKKEQDALQVRKKWEDKERDREMIRNNMKKQKEQENFFKRQFQDRQARIDQRLRKVKSIPNYHEQRKELFYSRNNEIERSQRLKEDMLIQAEKEWNIKSKTDLRQELDKQMLFKYQEQKKKKLENRQDAIKIRKVQEKHQEENIQSSLEKLQSQKELGEVLRKLTEEQKQNKEEHQVMNGREYELYKEWVQKADSTNFFDVQLERTFKSHSNNASPVPSKRHLTPTFSRSPETGRRSPILQAASFITNQRY